MDLETYYDNGNNIVVAKPIGEVTTDKVKETSKKVLELSRNYNCNFLLFDMRLCSEGQSIIRGFESMSKLGETTGLTSLHKCAFVYDPENYPEERAKFIENVVTNRASNAFKFFTNYEEALTWLNKLRK
jgi:hypothetical protein